MEVFVNFNTIKCTLIFTIKTLNVLPSTCKYMVRQKYRYNFNQQLFCFYKLFIYKFKTDNIPIPVNSSHYFITLNSHCVISPNLLLHLLLF